MLSAVNFSERRLMFSAVCLFSNVVFPSVFLDISRNACEKYKEGLLNIKQKYWLNHNMIWD